MKHPHVAPRLSALTVALCLFVPLESEAGPNRGAGNQSFPRLRLQAPQRGRAAIDHLGTRLPEVARAYGLRAADLHRLLLADRFLTVDVEGRLHYAEPAPAAAAVPAGDAGAAAIPAEQTFFLHSQPGSKRTIYLDFDGHVLAGTAWNLSYNAGANIVAPAFDLDGDPATFNAAELSVIQQVWLRVAEDYAPFDVDVTTELASEDQLTRSSYADDIFGQRILISPISPYFGSYGGLAYVGTFDDVGNTYKTALIFPERLNGLPKYIAEAAAHECGHSLGLNHDGLSSGDAYYAGHGAGETSWAPLMGAGYYSNLTQWSRGEYGYANNGQDDLAVMQTFGVTYRADDHGDTPETAASLTGGAAFTGSGLIERNTDVDVFALGMGAGQLDLTVAPVAVGPNLDVALELRDATGNLVAAAAPEATLAASLSLALEAGTYFLHVRGAASGDVLGTGHSAYGSLGQYSVTGSVTGAPTLNEVAPVPPVAVANFSAMSGVAGQTAFTFDGSGSFDPDGTLTDYRWSFGDGTEGAGASVGKVYAVAGDFEVVLTVTDNSGLTHSVAGAVSVMAPNVPPVAVIAASQTSGPAPLVLTLSGDGSTDADGTVVSYAWNFGDGTTANGATVTKTFSAAGNYTVVLTVSDNRGGTAASSVLLQVTTPAKVIRVQSLSLALQPGSGSRNSVRAVTKVTDLAGKAVAGVKVSFRWSGLVSETGGGTTDPNGNLTVNSRSFSNSGSVTFAVTGLSRSGYTYNPGNNLVTSATLSAARKN